MSYAGYYKPGRAADVWSDFVLKVKRDDREAVQLAQTKLKALFRRHIPSNDVVRLAPTVAE